MKHLHLTREPRIGERFTDGKHMEITRVTHHGGTRMYTIKAKPVFDQFPQERTYSGEIR